MVWGIENFLMSAKGEKTVKPFRCVVVVHFLVWWSFSIPGSRHLSRSNAVQIGILGGGVGEHVLNRMFIDIMAIQLESTSALPAYILFLFFLHATKFLNCRAWFVYVFSFHFRLQIFIMEVRDCVLAISTGDYMKKRFLKVWTRICFEIDMIK